MYKITNLMTNAKTKWKMTERGKDEKRHLPARLILNTAIHYNNDATQLLT